MKQKIFVLYLLILMSVFLLSGAAVCCADDVGPYGGCAAVDRVLSLSTPHMTGNDVQELQERLNELGYYNSEINGIYNKNTYQAVKKFQKNKGLETSGVVDDETWTALSSAIEAGEISKKAGPDGKVNILVDIDEKQLIIYSDGEPYQMFPVAVGRMNTPTPVGEWIIVNKGSKQAAAFGPRWMGLNVPWGNYGIHGTNRPFSIGSSASKGCVRMFNEHVKILYDWVPVGTPVKIIGHPKMPPNADYRERMQRGSVGPDVVQVQLKLKEKGFLIGKADGRYGALTEFSVRIFQHYYKFQLDGEVGEEIYEFLGLKRKNDA